MSVEVFAGNTADTSTFASQVRKVGQRFGGGTVTLVGDRGMIKGPQIDLLEATEGEFHYITAITKPQIESLLSGGQLQMQLFDEQLARSSRRACATCCGAIRRGPRNGRLAASKQAQRRATAPGTHSVPGPSMPRPK